MDLTGLKHGADPPNNKPRQRGKEMVPRWEKRWARPRKLFLETGWSWQQPRSPIRDKTEHGGWPDQQSRELGTEERAPQGEPAPGLL